MAAVSVPIEGGLHLGDVAEKFGQARLAHHATP